MPSKLRFHRNLLHQKSAFTLIELIIVIAIISILAAAIFVAVDPARRLHEARNARRRSDITTVLEAVKTYQVDNEGDHYTTIDGMGNNTTREIGTCGSGGDCPDFGALSSAVCVDISGIGDTYLAEVPVDPLNGDDAETRYYITKSASGAITIGACDVEGEGEGGAGTPPEIKVSR